MTTYKYRAKKGPGDIVEGAIEAPSESEAIDKLSHMGYLPMRIEVQSGGAVQDQGRAQAFKSSPGRVRSREVTVFSRQLASLLRAGVPILSAINIIAEQTENTNLKKVLYDIHDAVKEGENFSSSLMRYPRIFSPLYVAMVRTGENSGGLPEVLLRISDYRMKEDEIYSRLRMALAYPALMGAVGVATIIFMLAFVMPRLMGIFVNMGQNLPLPTRLLISISGGLRKWWWAIIVIFAIAVSLVKAQAKSKAGRIYFSMLILSIPIFGKLTLKAELSRFSRTLALLVESGIPILKAIDISIPVLENEIIRRQLAISYRELEQGGSFGRSLKNSKLFPLFMTNLIIVGEESGRLGEALAEVANVYEKDTDEAIKIMASLLEPLMILGMGLVVGFIVVAMLLPIFEINVMVR
ncbi:MAG: type II secretion system F family protein [Candidatus Omnitrophica bacterium]|nr:type II secretion system F family protein [Candidatus Omnitrophota bacterium]